jgi:glycolate oxidase iron-sulfur subunit
VAYGRLADIGRGLLEEKLERPRRDRLLRWALRKLMSHSCRFAAVLGAARLLRPLLPAALKARVPVRRPAPAWPTGRHGRRMLLLAGCVQPALAPAIDAAAAGVLDRLGIGLDRAKGSGCCGALSYHLGAHAEGLDFMRRNIDAWWPHLEAGAEAIVITASGCGALVKEYGLALQHDPAYADKARQVSARARDLVEVVAAEDLSKIRPRAPGRIAFQSPCSLQHGQKLGGSVETLLENLGFELTPVAESHLCCGSAGTYSVLQADLANQLRARKLAALEAGQPDLIATANIGCLSHLEAASTRPVRHWIELLAPASGDGAPAP